MTADSSTTSTCFERQGPGTGCDAHAERPRRPDQRSRDCAGEKDTNTTDQWFARGALRWQPTDAVELQLNFVHQYIESANGQYSNPGYAGGVLNLTTASATAAVGHKSGGVARIHRST